MSLHFCSTCSCPRQRNGSKTASFRDLSENGMGSIRRRVRVQRYTCRKCGSTSYDEGPVLADGHMMTPTLRACIIDAVAESSIVSVAKTFGLNRKTVARIWSDHLASFQPDAIYPVHAELVTCLIQGGEVTAVVDRGNDAVVHLFPDIASPDLISWLKGHSGGSLLTGWRHLPVCLLHAPVGLLVSCGRHQMLDFLADQMESLVAEARNWFDRHERQALRQIEAALSMPYQMRSPRQDRMVQDASGKHHRLRELVGIVDGYRSIWFEPSRVRAKAMLASWSRSLTAFGKAVMKSIVDFANRYADAIFSVDYALSRTKPALAVLNHVSRFDRRRAAEIFTHYQQKPEPAPALSYRPAET